MPHRFARSPFLIGAAAVMVLGLVGCSAGDYAPRADVGQAPPVDAVALPAQSLERALAALPGDIRRILDESGVPGVAVAVVQGEEVLFAEGFGVRELGTTAAVDEETVFQIASMSKPIGATVVATQVDAGVVDWTTPVPALLPGFSLADPWVTAHATVGDFYAHRTGLPAAAGDELEDLGYDRAYILDHLRYQPLDPFRSTYHYANFGITTGGEAVARAAGMDWATLSERAIYTPLHMDSTSSRYADFLARENRATLHAKIADGEFAPLYQRMPDAQAPAGGVSSNVVDIAKWLSFVIGDGTVSGAELADPAALLPATSPEIVSVDPGAPDMRAGYYGFGFNVGTQPSGRVTVSHSGAFILGAGTNFQIVPSLGLGVVALTNAAPVGAAESIVAGFLDRVQFGELTRDWLAAYGPALGHYFEPAGDLADATAPADPAAPGPLDGYAGVWHNAYYGDALVVVRGDALVVRLGPDALVPEADAVEWHLTTWDGDVFAFEPSGENAPPGSRSSAAFDPAAGTMTLGYYDTSGLGVWTR